MLIKKLGVYYFILSMEILDGGSKGCLFETHRRQSLKQTLYQLLSTGSTQEDPSQHDYKIADWDEKKRVNKANYMISKLYLYTSTRENLILFLRTTKALISLRIRSLISAFVIRYLGSTVVELSVSA